MRQNQNIKALQVYLTNIFVRQLLTRTCCNVFLPKNKKTSTSLSLVYTACKIVGVQAVADPENFGGGGFEAQNLKNSDVFTKIESDFSAEIGNSIVFFAQIQVVSKKKKKKKKVFTKIETDFSPDSLRLGRWGGCIPKWSRIIRNRG